MRLPTIFLFLSLRASAGSEIRGSSDRDLQLVVEPPSSCAAITCPAPSDCAEKDGIAECVPLDVCSVIDCDVGQICIPRDVVCVTAPCPPIPSCVDNPCNDDECPPGSVCRVDKEGRAACDDPCATMECEAGEECRFDPATGVSGCGPIQDVCQDFECPVAGQICAAVAVVCVTEPCDPVPNCIDDPCGEGACPPGIVCKMDKTGSAVCVDPCEGIECKSGDACRFDLDANDGICEPVCKGVECSGEGEICIARQVVCVTSPCPPVASCIPDPCATFDCTPEVCRSNPQGNAECVDPCTGVACNLGEECRSHPTTGETTCGPIQDVCEVVECRSEDEICVVREVICIAPPCPPVAACITDPCTVLRCAAGACRVDSEGNGVCVDPCEEVVCRPGDKCRFDPTTGGTSCGPTEDVCEDFLCEVEGQICFPREVSCVAAPCPPIPTCIDNPCAVVRCEPGTACRVDGEGNAVCFPVPLVTPVTKPPPLDPCALRLCPEDQPVCQVDPETGDTRCVASDTTDNEALTPTTTRDATGELLWWKRLMENFAGTRLKRCFKRNDTPPTEGVRCARRPKTCFFGTQDCPNGVGPHPVTRCFCSGRDGEQVWRCGEAACPDLPTDPID